APPWGEGGGGGPPAPPAQEGDPAPVPAAAVRAPDPGGRPKDRPGDRAGARRVDRDIAARCDAPAPAHVETAVAGHGDVAGRGGHVDLAHVAAVAVRGVEGRVDDDAALRIQTEAAAGGAIVDVIAAVDADACARDVDVALH